VSAVLGRAHFVTCLDREAMEAVRRCAPGVPCTIVPNPALVDDRFSPADETDELVVFAGEISLRKGADVLCAAWRLVASRRPAARCLMVGPVRDFSPPPAERLHVRSPATPTEMKEILRRARVVALPARAEGMPMVLTEAMGVGRPFVSTPVGGVPELADAGGLLVPIEDELALADRLTELLSDRHMARAIGERGRRFCAKTRSVAVIDARLRALYSGALAEARRAAAPCTSAAADRAAPL
jgi:glycosyltransferase involved in cell wall biosynthesis